MKSLNLNEENTHERHKVAVFRLILITIFAVILSLIIWSTLWRGNELVIHSSLEIACIFVGVSTFLLSWNTYHHDNWINRMIGFGFFITSCFDLIHVYYYQSMYRYKDLPIDLPLKFWMISKLTLVLVIFMLGYCSKIQESIKVCHFMRVRRIQGENSANKGKWLSLITSIAFVVVMWYVFYNIAFINLYTDQGVTKTKIILELIITVLLIVTLIKLHRTSELNEKVKLEYIFMSLLAMIVNEIFALSATKSTSFFLLLGHVMKIVSYHFLYKGIFETTVREPHRKMEEANSKLVDILDAVPVALVTYNEDNKLSYANKSFEQVIGWSREELIGLSPSEFLKIIPKAEEHKEEALVEQVLKTGEKVNGVIRTYSTSKGDRIKLLVNAHKINDGALMIFNDVKAEQQIADLNLQTQIILNSIGTPAVILDNLNRITAHNIAFTNLIHRDDIDIVKMSIDELITMLDGSITLLDKKYDKDILIEESYEGFFQCINGKQRSVLIKVSTIYNIENENIGAVCVIQDITDEKENQQKLINQEKLALLGQMSATIVHETRNFLTTIKGCSQLIQTYTKEDRIKLYAEKINCNTNEVNKIISNLLTMSKPSKAVMEEVSINDLIYSLKSTLETSTMTKGVDVQFNLNFDERYILCDEGQIMQVILNLCKNAMDAMSDTKDALLTIETGLREENEELFIKVSDNGVGISQKNLAKIGTPFFTTKKSGTGLGLNACYQIIKNHKGKIEVKSEEAKGTTFIITIPCVTYEDLAEII